MFNLIAKFLNNFRTGHTLHVAFDSGAKRKPTIVLLHGIAATSATWDILIKDLDMNKYRVVALDLLGFGRSPRLDNCQYSVDDHVRYVRRTLRRLSIKKPYIIVGHSMGSIIAARYGRLYSRDVSRLFLLSLPMYLKSGRAKASLPDIQIDIFMKLYNFLSENKSFTIKQSQNIKKLMRVGDGIDITEETWNSFRLSLKNTIIKQDTYNDIKAINAPIDVIYGNLDEFLVQKNIDDLSILDNVTITKLNIVDHQVGTRFAKKVSEMINRL